MRLGVGRGSEHLGAPNTPESDSQLVLDGTSMQVS